MSATTAAAAASSAAHGGKRAEFAAAGLAPAGNRGKHGDGASGRLLANRTVGAGGVHGLELIKLVVAGRAVIFIYWHTI